MGRNVKNPRTIKGQIVTADEHKRQIIECVRSFGEEGASIPEVMGLLLIPQDQYIMMAATFRWLLGIDKEQRKPNQRKRPALLRRIAHGRYVAIGAVMPAHGISKAERLRAHMVDVARRNGGFIRTRDMLRAFDIYATKAGSEAAGMDVRSTPEYFQITRFLHEHPFVKIGHGLSRLSWEEIEKLPMEGRWCLEYFSLAASARDAKGGSTVVYAAEERVRRQLYNHFMDIGALTEGLIVDRGWNWVLDLLNDPTLVPAFREWVERAENLPLRQSFNRAVGTGDGNIFDDYVPSYGAMQNARKYCDHHFPGDATYDAPGLALLRHFCDGYRSAHDTAPQAFYSAFAAKADVCPIQFSRGVLWPAHGSDEWAAQYGAKFENEPIDLWIDYDGPHETLPTEIEEHLPREGDTPVHSAISEPVPSLPDAGRRAPRPKRF